MKKYILCTVISILPIFCMDDDVWKTLGDIPLNSGYKSCNIFDINNHNFTSPINDIDSDDVEKSTTDSDKSTSNEDNNQKSITSLKQQYSLVKCPFHGELIYYGNRANSQKKRCCYAIFYDKNKRPFDKLKNHLSRQHRDKSSLELSELKQRPTISYASKEIALQELNKLNTQKNTWDVVPCPFCNYVACSDKRAINNLQIHILSHKDKKTKLDIASIKASMTVCESEEAAQQVVKNLKSQSRTYAQIHDIPFSSNKRKRTDISSKNEKFEGVCKFCYQSFFQIRKSDAKRDVINHIKEKHIEDVKDHNYLIYDPSKQYDYTTTCPENCTDQTTIINNTKRGFHEDFAKVRSALSNHLFSVHENNSYTLQQLDKYIDAQQVLTQP